MEQQEANVRASRGEQEETAIPVVEEELRVGKREVESGGVRVTQRIEERPVERQVTLRDETIEEEIDGGTRRG